MSSHTMPAADAAWLRMESPANPMVVNAVIWFDEPLDWQRVKDAYERRIVDRYPRFRQRVADRLRRPAFVDDPDFDLERHFHRVALPAPGDRQVLQELISDLITPPLDCAHPLWQVHLIEGYGEGCAILTRVHHCVADGIALAQVMMSLTEQEQEQEPEPPSNGGGGAALGSLVRPAAGALTAARRIPGAVVQEGMESLAHPEHLARLAETAVQDAGTLAKLVTRPADARTVLKRPLHGTRRVVWSRPFPLERVKAAGRRREATINDVLVAGVTGALRSYLQRHDSLPEDVHVVVPFNLRPLQEPVSRELGNEFALLLLGLPVGIEDREERLREVKMRMDAVKHSHEGPISFGLLSAIGMTPAQVEARLIGFFTDKASAVVTNVPGPRETVHLAGAPVRGVLVWAPCSGSLGLTVSIFSYAGEVTAGFMSDIGLVPDPQPLVDVFHRELRAYAA
ncbi:MAG TPA: wax ester/triacylglycerol synthase family O-acyltransferase [Thermoleophilaceae bacterium]